MITAVSGGSLVTGEDAEADVGNNFRFPAKRLSETTGLVPGKVGPQ
jgi:hypothetical protein